MGAVFVAFKWKHLMQDCIRGKTGSKRIFYVTNEDDPMEAKKGKTEQQRIALERVRVCDNLILAFIQLLF